MQIVRTKQPVMQCTMLWILLKDKKTNEFVAKQKWTRINPNECYNIFIIWRPNIHNQPR